MQRGDDLADRRLGVHQPRVHLRMRRRSARMEEHRWGGARVWRSAGGEQHPRGGAQMCGEHVCG
eukprot:338041-Chlamydomonas_euryale.AAC.3